MPTDNLPSRHTNVPISSSTFSSPRPSSGSCYRYTHRLEEVSVNAFLNIYEKHIQDNPRWLLSARNLARLQAFAKMTGNSGRVRQIRTHGLEKANIIVVATLTASGSKLPLIFRAARSIDRVHDTQIGKLSGNFWVSHSLSGRQTEWRFRMSSRRMISH
jgi:hypothetical protein